jgi:class 3 adenylate cyclase
LEEAVPNAESDPTGCRSAGLHTGRHLWASATHGSAMQPPKRPRVGCRLSRRQPQSDGDLGSPETTAEHRPLSVMFCGLVGSTALSRLDPEDLREIVATTIQRFDWCIARSVGDGVLIHFGCVGRILAMAAWSGSAATSTV